jgi:hypothetical protein
MRTPLGLALCLAIGCSSGGGYNGGGIHDLSMTGTPDFSGLTLDFSMPENPDLSRTTSPDMAMAGTRPVGATCTSSGQCTGTNPVCLNTLGTITLSGGYCSNKVCTSDQSCGTGGFCDTTGGTSDCLESCTNAGDCSSTNSNNSCFYWDNNYNACLPTSLSTCDPTVSNNCSSLSLCDRQGPDNVGSCLTSCTFGGTCANDSRGNARNCYLLNNKVKTDGTTVSGDTLLGLGCYTTNNLAAGATCTYTNDCVSGYECNYYMVGSLGKVCAKMCRNGGTDCNGTGHTCQDAFKTGVTGDWTTGQVGLCL